MSRQPRIFPDTMSLHDIKGQTQLTYAMKQADDIADNLEKLIENTRRKAPVRRAWSYKLSSEHRHNLTPSVPHSEKHWEEAIFRKWEKDEDGLDPLIPFRKIVCCQMMLRDTNKDEDWGEIDLLGVTAENVPVVIELKVKEGEYLLDAIAEVLAYGVVIREAWSGPLRPQWVRDVGKIDSLVDLPLVVMAPSSYWKVVLSDSPNRIRFQTPQHVRQSIKKLLEKMHRVHYPLTFVEVNAEQQLEKSGLPVITNAVLKGMPIPTGSW